jgi:hypothetical protein
MLELPINMHIKYNPRRRCACGRHYTLLPLPHGSAAVPSYAHVAPFDFASFGVQTQFWPCEHPVGQLIERAHWSLTQTAAAPRVLEPTCTPKIGPCTANTKLLSATPAHLFNHFIETPATSQEQHGITGQPSNV